VASPTVVGRPAKWIEVTRPSETGGHKHDSELAIMRPVLPTTFANFTLSDLHCRNVWPVEVAFGPLP